jgi:hypothetical protein
MDAGGTVERQVCLARRKLIFRTIMDPLLSEFDPDECAGDALKRSPGAPSAASPALNDGPPARHAMLLYLCGELDAASVQRFERKLAATPALRAQLAQLTQLDASIVSGLAALDRQSPLEGAQRAADLVRCAILERQDRPGAVQPPQFDPGLSDSRRHRSPQRWRITAWRAGGMATAAIAACIVIAWALVAPPRHDGNVGRRNGSIAMVAPFGGTRSAQPPATAPLDVVHPSSQLNAAAPAASDLDPANAATLPAVRIQKDADHFVDQIFGNLDEDARLLALSKDDSPSQW